MWVCDMFSKVKKILVRNTVDYIRNVGLNYSKGIFTITYYFLFLLTSLMSFLYEYNIFKLCMFHIISEK